MTAILSRPQCVNPGIGVLHMMGLNSAIVVQVCWWPQYIKFAKYLYMKYGRVMCGAFNIPEKSFNVYFKQVENL